MSVAYVADYQMIQMKLWPNTALCCNHQSTCMPQFSVQLLWYRCTVCRGSVVVTAHDFESGRPGSNPEWGPIYYKPSITAQGLIPLG